MYKNKYLDKVRFLGSLFGLAIRLKLQIYINLDTFLLYQMIHDDFDTLTPDKIEDIITNFDSKLFNYNPYNCFKKSKWLLDDNCKMDPITGLETLKINDRAIETIEKIKDSNDSIKPLVTAFVQGFRGIININLIELKDKPIRVLDLLLVGERELTLDKIFGEMNFQGFNEPKKTFMKEIIRQNYIDSGSNIKYLEKLLELITATERLPAGGYPPDKLLTIKLEQIDYEHEPFNVNTCHNYMKINPIKFNESFHLGIPNIKQSILYNYFSLDSITTILSLGYTKA